MNQAPPIARPNLLKQILTYTIVDKIADAANLFLNEPNNARPSAREIIDTREIYPLCLLPSTHNPFLTKNEESSLADIIVKTSQAVCPEAFQTENEDTINEIDCYEVFRRAIDRFTKFRLKNLKFSAWVKSRDIQLSVEECSKADECFHEIVKYLEWLSLDEKYERSKNPAHKGITPEQFEKLDELLNELNSPIDNESYFEKLDEYRALKSLIDSVHIDNIRNGLDYVLDAFTPICPPFASIRDHLQDSSDEFITQLIKKEANISKRKDFEQFIENCFAIPTAFETNYLRNFWETLYRNQYGKTFYQIICEASKDNDSRLHKKVLNIWYLSILDSISQKPKIARSRMPEISYNGVKAPNFGYRIDQSDEFKNWIKNENVRNSATIIADTLDWIVRKANLIDDTKKDSFPYLDEFCFQLDLTYPEEGVHFTFIVSKSIINFAKSTNLSNDSGEDDGFVFGIGFNGEMFASPSRSQYSNTNEIIFNFSKSHRNEDGEMFLEYLAYILENPSDELKKEINNESDWSIFDNCDIKIAEEIPEFEEKAYEKGREFLLSVFTGRTQVDYPDLIPLIEKHWDSELNKSSQSVEDFVKNISPSIAVSWKNRLEVLVQGFRNNFTTKAQEKIGSFENKIKKLKNSIKKLDGNLIRATNDSTKLQILNTINFKQEEMINLYKSAILKFKFQSQVGSPSFNDWVDLLFCEFKNFFFANNNASNCIEPLLAREVGHDHFLPFFIGPSRKAKNSTAEFGKKPFYVIPPCDDKCQINVISHLFASDLLGPQNAETLNEMRNRFSFPKIVDRIVPLEELRRD